MLEWEAYICKETKQFYAWNCLLETLFTTSFDDLGNLEINNSLVIFSEFNNDFIGMKLS